MRYLGTRAAAALLTTVFVAASGVPAATAQPVGGVRLATPRPSSKPAAAGLDQTVRKALRATGQPGRWELLIEVEGEWSHHSYLKEVFRRRPEPSIAQDEALKDLLDSHGLVLLIGEVSSGRDRRVFTVGAVLDRVSWSQDADGEAFRPFIPLHVNESYQDALQFARSYERSFDGSAAAGSLPDSPSLPATAEDFAKVTPCEQACVNRLNADLAACRAAEQACIASADFARDACLSTCPPGDLLCSAGCVAAWVIIKGSCPINRQICEGVAYDMAIFCDNQCVRGGVGECLTATDTETATLSLREPTGRGQKLLSAPLDFPLARSESRDGETFIMDEWAIVQDGEVRRSSNPAFGRALTDQNVEKSLASFLVIQEPVHDRNSRHVPKPQVRVSSTRLTASEKGAGELVAARLELSPAKEVDRVEIVYTSEPMEEGRLKQLIGQRVGLEFATEQGHRTAVYVVFRLTDRVEVLGTATAFPKCCCGGMRCV